MWDNVYIILYPAGTSSNEVVQEICAISRISKKEIGKCFKLIIKNLEKSVDVITSDDFMSRFCHNLELPKHVQIAASHIAKKGWLRTVIFINCD